MDKLEHVKSSDSDIISALLAASDHLPPPGSDVNSIPVSLVCERTEQKGHQSPIDAKRNLWAQPILREQHCYPTDSPIQTGSSGDLFPLPMHTEELGRLPLYFDLNDVTQASENRSQVDGTLTFGGEIEQSLMFAQAQSFSTPGTAASSSPGEYLPECAV